MTNVKKSQGTTAENGAEMTKEMFFNIVNNPNYTKKGYCSSWYYFDFNGVQIEAYDAWDDFTTVFSFTIGGEENYVSMPFKANGTKIRERVMTKAYNEIKRKIKSSKSTEAENSVATSAQEEKVYGEIEIRESEGDLIYQNYGKKSDLDVLAKTAIKKLESLGYKTNSLDRGRYWELVDKKGVYGNIYVEITSYTWNSLESECDEVKNSIPSYLED